MAFIFVVETGTGDSDANSYTSVAFADDYISINTFASAQWEALDDEVKERLLVRASKYFDRMIKWEGERVEEESGLRWPRSGVFDADGLEIPSDMIPLVLQEAVAEFACYLMSEDWTAPQSSRGMSEIKVDVIELKFDAEVTRGSLPDYIIAMLSDLGAVNKGTRPAFKKVIRH